MRPAVDRGPDWASWFPSGLYSDNGTGALRRTCSSSGVDGSGCSASRTATRIFPIHRSYKFNPVVIVSKGGATEAVRTAFMRRKLDDWERAEDFTTAYTRAQVRSGSVPRSRAILEIQSEAGPGNSREDLRQWRGSPRRRRSRRVGHPLLARRVRHDERLAASSAPGSQWEARGYRPDEYSRWLLGDWRPIEELWEANSASIRPGPSRWTSSSRSGCSTLLPDPNDERQKPDSCTGTC